MYKITLEQKEDVNGIALTNRIVLEHLEREEAVGIMFDLVGHLDGGIKLEKEEAPC